MKRSSRAVPAFLVGVILCSTAWAQGSTRTEVLRAAGDRFPIRITYYPALEEAVPGGTMNAPVVVFLHGEHESRLLWDKNSVPRVARDRDISPFPAELQKRGYAAITVDLRKHGESLREGEEPIHPTDYTGMVRGDMIAVKRFIFEEHQNKKLNMSKMGIVASGFSAAVAAAFAEHDWRQPPYDDHAIPARRTRRGQDVRALVLISPQPNAGPVRTSRSVNYLRGPGIRIALQVVVGNDDTANRRTAETLYNSFAGQARNADRAELIKPELKDVGIALLTKDPSAAYVPILKFLDTHLRDLDIPWTDRRSRLER